MRNSTACFLLRRKRVLLAPRKEEPGVGNFSPYGGKVDGKESIPQTLVREIEEESRLHIEESDLIPAAIVVIHLGKTPRYRIHVFTCEKWRGVAQETTEMGRPKWFSFDELPTKKMWLGDREWLPKILAGEPFFEAGVHLDKQDKLIGDVTYRHRTTPILQGNSSVLRT